MTAFLSSKLPVGAKKHTFQCAPMYRNDSRHKSGYYG
jgi:hypothetical protein